jgi:class 3 adenylate cyclase
VDTVLFTDLVGFTAYTEEAGDERGAEVCVAFRRDVGRLLAAYDATEVKSLGDGLMLRVRDPRAAVRLGLQVTELGPVPVRVGMHTGPVVERDGDLYGMTVNVAARLCSAAGGGEVLVSEATLRAAGAVDGIALGARRLHWLKNLREPVAAHLAAPAPRPRLRERLAARRPCPFHAVKEVRA